MVVQVHGQILVYGHVQHVLRAAQPEHGIHTLVGTRDAADFSIVELFMDVLDSSQLPVVPATRFKVRHTTLGTELHHPLVQVLSERLGSEATAGESEPAPTSGVSQVRVRTHSIFTVVQSSAPAWQNKRRL